MRLLSQWWRIATRNGEHRLVIDALLLGIVGAACAQAFQWMLGVAQRFFLGMLAGYQPPGAAGESPVGELIGPHGRWLIPVATTLGGLLTGLLVYSLAPEAEGHGTDDVVRAFHRAGGYLRARVPVVKMIASAITIGSGGAAGREGPTALIAAGTGSVYARLGRRSERETRLIILMGMAAGLSAIFRSPIGTAIFAIEVLYSEMEFEGGALLYTMLAAVVAYGVNGLLVGFHPLFRIPAALAPLSAVDHLWYIVLGLASGLLATVIPVVFYKVRDAFRALPLPRHLKPAIGGLVVGLHALVLPQVVGGGYGWIQEAIDGRLAPLTLVMLAFAKITALAFTVGSGGSGGVFAPSLYCGAMLGGFVGWLLHQPVPAFVVVGMAAVFAGAARVPIATMLMVTEMTGGYNLLTSAALAVMVSYFVQTTLSRSFRYCSLYSQQVPTRADSPAHLVEALQGALDFLNQPDRAVPSRVGELKLVPLLTSGVPVSLPDGRRMKIGIVGPGSPYIGKPIRSGSLPGAGRDVDVLRIWRNGSSVWPGPESVLEQGDRILIIASEDAWKKLAPNFDSTPP